MLPKQTILELRAKLGTSSHFEAISALQYMSSWGDFGVKIKNNETLEKTIGQLHFNFIKFTIFNSKIHVEVLY